MGSQAILIISTVPSVEVGEQIANALLVNKLAACVNIMPSVTSLYTWKGDICSDNEVLLFIKSRPEYFIDRVIDTIKSIHPYEVPEIIAIPIIMGDQPYLEWIRETTELEK